MNCQHVVTSGDCRFILLPLPCMKITLELDLPDDAPLFRLPPAVTDRLRLLLDRQDAGEPMTGQELHEAEGLIEMSELFRLLRLRTRRIKP